MRLPGNLFGELLDAIIDAYQGLGADELQIMVQIHLNENPVAFVNWNRALRPIISDLIRRYEAQDRIVEFILGARLSNPTNLQLREFAERFKLPSATNVGREKLVAPNLPFTSLNEWIAKLFQLMRSIAVVAVGQRGEKGTGFLVGNDLVLTNYHVVKDLFNGADPRDAVPERDHVQFDNYRSLQDGQLLPVAARPLQESWCAGSSAEAKLDFALVRIASEQAGSTPREPLMPEYRMPNIGEAIIVLQHPGAGQLKVAFGKITEIQPSTGYILHDAHTSDGSSGAPVLTANLNPIALHWGNEMRYNCGSSLSSILSEFPNQQFPR